MKWDWPKYKEKKGKDHISEEASITILEDLEQALLVIATRMETERSNGC